MFGKMLWTLLLGSFLLICGHIALLMLSVEYNVINCVCTTQTETFDQRKAQWDIATPENPVKKKEAWKKHSWKLRRWLARKQAIFGAESTQGCLAFTPSARCRGAQYP